LLAVINTQLNAVSPATNMLLPQSLPKLQSWVLHYYQNKA